MNTLLLAFTSTAGEHMVAGRNTAALAALECARSCRNIPLADRAALDAIISDFWDQLASHRTKIVENS